MVVGQVCELQAARTAYGGEMRDLTQPDQYDPPQPETRTTTNPTQTEAVEMEKAAIEWFEKELGRKLTGTLDKSYPKVAAKFALSMRPTRLTPLNLRSAKPTRSISRMSK